MSDELVAAAGPVAVDADLLALADATLQSAGYRSTHSRAGRIDCIVGRNDDAIVLVGAFFDVRSLLLSEAELSRACSDALLEAGIPRPDGYTILLTAQHATVDDASSIYGVAYNLQRVRRIVRSNVEISAIGVARALRPVLPLPKPGTSSSTSDPFTELQKRLISSGVPAPTVRAAVDRFAREDDGDPTIDDLIVEDGDDR